MRNGKLTDAGRAELKKGRRRSKSKKTTIPAVRYLRYNLTNSAEPDTETSHYIDIMRDLSAINRRLYRQGRRVHVKRITVISSNTIANGSVDPSARVNAGRVSFSTAPESWVSQKAWQRGLKLFQQMQKRAMDAAGNDFRGAYNDFKVYLTTDHATGTQLVPVDNGNNAVKLGDWSYSDFVSPDGTTSSDEYYTTLLGNHVQSGGLYTSVSLVKSYGESRATVSEAPTPGTFAVDVNDPLMNLFDDGTQIDEILGKFQTDGEDPPYDIDDYPGDNSNMPKPLVVQDTTLGQDGKATVGGFTAMCGLIEIESKSPIANDVYSVLVELAPGSYRGIKADVI